MESIFYFFYNHLVNRAFGEHYALLINFFLNLIIVSLFCFFLYKLIMRAVLKTFSWFSKRTNSHLDDYLLKTKFVHYVSQIIPFIVISQCVQGFVNRMPFIENISGKLISIYYILLVVWIIRSIFRALKNYLKSKDTFKDKPIDSFLQIFVMLLWFIGILSIISVITNKSALTFLTTLGAASAIILLVFRDTILGFVASIQVSINDTIRIGDWVTQEKFGADGDVIEINLTTVRVRNFDNTYTTIPTYSLISDSFKNWRGMIEGAGRRIKRQIYIKQSSVRFLKNEDVKKFKDIQLISDYIMQRQDEINQYNQMNNFSNNLLSINGRNQTNLGLFRKYCERYLQKNPHINNGMTLIVRPLQSGNNGIPIEIYAFSKDKNWINYENIQADIIEHIIATTSYFDLEVFESINNLNFSSLTNEIKS